MTLYFEQQVIPCITGKHRIPPRRPASFDARERRLSGVGARGVKEAAPELRKTLPRAKKQLDSFHPQVIK